MVITDYGLHIQSDNTLFFGVGIDLHIRWFSSMKHVFITDYELHVQSNCFLTSEMVLTCRRKLLLMKRPFKGRRPMKWHWQLTRKALPRLFLTKLNCNWCDRHNLQRSLVFNMPFSFLVTDRGGRRGRSICRIRGCGGCRRGGMWKLLRLFFKIVRDNVAMVRH